MQTITSKDGTIIAYEKQGSGPTVILIEGATATRAASVKLANLLSSKFTVYSFDRRGRGDSADTQPYTIDREIEDIEALIDLAGGKVFVYAISSGGALALEAASKLGQKIEKLAIYEVPYDESEQGKAIWHEYRANLTKALNEHNRTKAVETFMKFVGVPDDMISGMKQAPFWGGLEKIAPTLEYDAACLGDERIIPVDRFKLITAQTRVMDGGASEQAMPFMKATADKLAQTIPQSKRETLPGQTHDVDMQILSQALESFFLS